MDKETKAMLLALLIVSAPLTLAVIAGMIVEIIGALK